MLSDKLRGFTSVIEAFPLLLWTLATFIYGSRPVAGKTVSVSLPKNVPGAYEVAQSTSLSRGIVSYSLLNSGTSYPIIVILTGVLSTMFQYSFFAERLASAGFRVLRLDWYDHGRSFGKKIKRYSPDLFAGQVSELLDKLGLGNEKITLIGHSMGGLLAVHFSVRFPEKISKLVLLAPAGFVPKTRAFKLINNKPTLTAIRRLFRTFSPSSLVASLCPFPFIFKKWHPVRKWILLNTKYIGEYDAMRYLVVASRLTYNGVNLFNDYEVYDRLSKLNIDVHFFWGALDDTTPIGHALPHLSDKVGHLPLKVYSKCGHHVYIDKEGRLVKDIVAFVRHGERNKRISSHIWPEKCECNSNRWGTVDGKKAESLILINAACSA